MYRVVLGLDSNKHWLDHKPLVIVGRKPTAQEASNLMEWVGRDLQDKGYYIGDQLFTNALSIYERQGEDLTYIGCTFYLEDRS
jgi:hypothetical protein